MPAIYVLQIDKDGLQAQVYVNGVPVVGLGTLSHVGRTEALNPWCFGGSNELRLVLNRPEDAAGAPPARLALRVLQSQKGESGGTPLLEIQWPPKDKDQERYPHEQTQTFAVSEPPPGEFWQKAQAVVLNDDERGALRRLTGDLHAALAQRDAGAAAGLLEWKGIDIRKSLHMPTEQARSELRDYLDYFLSEPGWEIAPLKLDELELHALSGNRLVWVTEPEFVNPIRTKPGASPPIQIPLYFGKINGKWTIVR